MYLWGVKCRPKTRFDLLKQDIRKTIQAMQEKQKYHHDKGSVVTRNFNPGQIVRVRNVRIGVKNCSQKTSATHLLSEDRQKM